jgi:hypothetical protein
LLDQFNASLWHRDASGRFLLEGMGHVNGIGEYHGVYRAVGVLIVVSDDLQNSGTAKSFSGFAVGCLSPS